jgi:DNA-binding transcriptional ArsR family regulator
VKRDVFQALADPTRRAILLLVATQAMTPNAMADHFHTTRQAVSKHIRILAESKLLKEEKSGREIYYHVNAGKLKEIDKYLEQFRTLFENRFDQLDDVLQQLKTEKK